MTSTVPPAVYAATAAPNEIDQRKTNARGEADKIPADVTGQSSPPTHCCFCAAASQLPMSSSVPLW
jgi:hypothetical protein